MKTSNLTGAALDWMVAKCESRIGVHTKYLGGAVFDDLCEEWLRYSTDWAQGGPIIERERISVVDSRAEPGEWAATVPTYSLEYGPTPLIAAMRCYVASKLGGMVEIPDELV